VTSFAVFRWRETNDMFASLMKQAWLEYLDWGFDALHRQAVEGVSKAVYHNGKRVGTTREYSAAALRLWMQFMHPDKFPAGGARTVQTTNAQVNIAQVNSQLVVPLDSLSDEDFALLGRLIGRSGPLVVQPPELPATTEGEPSDEQNG
jgi:hypothetical protein